MTKCGIAVVGMWIATALTAATAGPIRVTNYRQGEAIRFPVPLICGTLADAKITSVTVVNSSSKRDTRA